MMEAVRTSETSVSYNETTRHNIPEGSNLQKRPYPYRESKRGPLALVSHLTNWAMSTNIDINRLKTCAWCFTLLVYSWSCQDQCYWSSICMLQLIYENDPPIYFALVNLSVKTYRISETGAADYVPKFP
jgi:hypothetical protein